ncbi:CMRF35-like molecule 1 isoform X5 [Trachinotus anak]|uniref:CMRF35-like molecule 1 isoform X5 n=1 Tax=Trachinotus anak TaxID=443729 RepID=UPI0039F25B83
MNNVKYLCKGYYCHSCSYAVKTNQRDSSGKFSISDDKNQRIFTVTIKDLTNKDTDYWCIVEINGGEDAGEYFHLSVTRGTPSLYVDHQEITGFNGGSINISCYSRNSGETGWCRLGRSCVTGSSGSIDGTSVTISARDPNVFTVTMSGLTTESSGWYLCHKGDLQMPVHVTVTEKPITTTVAATLFTIASTSPGHTPEIAGRRASVDLKTLIIPLSLLIFIVILTLFIWFMLKKHKQNNAKSSAMTMSEEEVTYCNVGYMRPTSGQRSHAEESNVDVMYSSVVTKRQQTPRKVEAQDDDVTYSSLAQAH